MAAKLFSSTYLQAGIDGSRNWDLSCRRQTRYQLSYADLADASILNLDVDQDLDLDLQVYKDS